MNESALAKEIEIENEHLANGEHEIIPPAPKGRNSPPAPSQHSYMDFEKIDRDLGFTEPGNEVEAHSESEDDAGGDKFKVVAAMLLPIGEFLTRPDDARTRGALTTAFFYCLKPELFDLKTLTEVGAAIGFEKAAFHKHVVSVRERFGLKPLRCKCDEGREKYRQLATGNKNYAGNGLIHRVQRKWEKKQSVQQTAGTVTTLKE